MLDTQICDRLGKIKYQQPRRKKEKRALIKHLEKSETLRVFKN